MPDNSLILYDGVCNLCNRWVQFVLKHDRQHQFSFAPLQGTTAKQLLAGQRHLKENPDTVILIDNDNIYTGSTAALRIFKKIGKGWNIFYALMVVPRFIRDGVYRYVANRRYKWFGKSESCMLPPEKWKGRFLE